MLLRTCYCRPRLAPKPASVQALHVCLARKSSAAACRVRIRGNGSTPTHRSLRLFAAAMPLWYGGNDIPDQSNRTIIITGGTSGLGLSTAKALTAKGAQVVITGRSPEKGDRLAHDSCRNAFKASITSVVCCLEPSKPSENTQRTAKSYSFGAMCPILGVSCVWLNTEALPACVASDAKSYTIYVATPARAVRDFAENYKRSGRKLHCLINNAGTALPPHSITENGFEVCISGLIPAI